MAQEDVRETQIWTGVNQGSMKHASCETKTDESNIERIRHADILRVERGFKKCPGLMRYNRGFPLIPDVGESVHGASQSFA